MAIPAISSPPLHHPLCFPKKDHSLINSLVKVFRGLLEGVTCAVGKEKHSRGHPSSYTTNLTREAMSVVEKSNTF